jgi:membrane fusion protein (multidrug efflux system)
MQSNTEADEQGPQSPPSGADQSQTERQTVPKPGWERLPRWFVPTLIIALAIFLVIVFVNDWNLWDGRRSVETTDDAYVRADITPLSTKIAGVVSLVAVTDFQHVKKGELIVQIRNDDFQAKVDQTAAAVTETEKSIEQLKRELEVQDTRITASQSATLVGNTNITQAATNIQSASATVDLSQSTIQQAQEAIAQAESEIRADEANAERAMLEKNRQEQLFAERATTKRAVEQIVANVDEATAAIARDKAKRDGARALLAARLSELRRAKDIQTNSQRDKRNAGDQYTKLEAEHKGHVKEKEVLLAREKVLAAELARKKAEGKEAQVALDYTFIRAPVDGTISERKVRAGQMVSPGTQAVTLVSAVPWVVANYREIQLSHVFVGNRAEVTVDGLPGVTFKGHVDTISPASEAQFALLPPENASGNFTKISQRIPVKITFEPEQKELLRMRPGMSVIARVWTK